MDAFDGVVLSDHMLSSLNMESIDLSGCFPSQMSSCNSIYGNLMWSDPSTRVKESVLDHTVLSCNNDILVASNSLPSTTSYGNDWDMLGYDPFYLHEGSFDNQSHGSVFCEPSSLQGLEDFNSTDLPTSFMQEHQTDDDIVRWISDTGLESTLNDDLLKSLVADLPAISSQNNVLTDDLRMHTGNHRREESLENIIMNTGAMECVSEVEGSIPALAPKKGLFSQLGLDHLLSNRTVSSTSANCSNEDQFSSPKKRRMDCYTAVNKSASLSCNPINNFTLKSEIGEWTDKSYTADAKSCITSQSERAEESSKVSKKRAKPGESTRPRPKDRQMIQDRMKELREIIPNGAKCSIDSLLERTIKHMIFMQEVMKYGDNLKQVDELKARRDKDNGGIGGSTAWAVEVGGQNPIVVEDLGQSGQMRIEMLCEDQGYFLEIADVIRSFGLTILKGVVEARADKIWAHFIVEANRQVTRMQVLMSLLQHLQDTSTRSETIADENKAVGDKTSSLLNNYHHQPMMSLPIGLADTLR